MVPGKDGLVSTVTLKPQKGRLRRPVQRLHRLEASTAQFLSDEFGDSGPNGGESATVCLSATTGISSLDVSGTNSSVGSGNCGLRCSSVHKVEGMNLWHSCW